MATHGNFPEDKSQRIELNGDANPSTIPLSSQQAPPPSAPVSNEATAKSAGDEELHTRLEDRSTGLAPEPALSPAPAKDQLGQSQAEVAKKIEEAVEQDICVWREAQRKTNVPEWRIAWEEIDMRRILRLAEKAKHGLSVRPPIISKIESTTPNQRPEKKSLILTAEQWLDLALDEDQNEIVLGSPGQAIIRPFTKNIVEAPEKAFKTSFTLRLALGMSSGRTVFQQLPVTRSRRVLYIHGELSPPEIKERTRAAAKDLPSPLDNLYQGRDLRIHLMTKEGQEVLTDIVRQYTPEDLVLDPWQSFIPGYDENCFEDVSVATHFLDLVIEQFGVTVYVVAHTGKDATRGMRGHSSLAGWRDTLITLERRRNGLVTVNVEPRWAPPVPAFNLKFENGTLWATDARVFSPQAERIREFLESQGGQATKEAIGEALGLKADALRKALERAEEQHAVAIDGNEVRIFNDRFDP